MGCHPLASCVQRAAAPGREARRAPRRARRIITRSKWSIHVLSTYQGSAGGQKITVNADFSLNVPEQPIVPFIEGDGTGADITPVMIKVVDAAVQKAYGGKRKIHWMEVYAGEKATKVYGPDVWLPEETLDVVKDYVVPSRGR